MKGFTQLTIAALAALASSTAINVNKRDTPLSVAITSTGNTEVKVAVTNNGDAALNLLSKGTFLDEKLPVEKVKLFSANKEVDFEGIRVRILETGLQQDAFTPLAPGETKEVTVETAALHSLQDGGDFDVFASGFIPYAEAGSTELKGNLAYESNKLTINVDGAKAAQVSKALDITKRTTVGSDCTGSKASAVRTALSNCNRLASAAASAAQAGTKLTTYFKSTSVASTVAARLNAVAADCAGGSATQTHCTDTYQGCESNVLAYTVPSQNYIVYCDLYFSDLPALASSCHAQDQATTSIHETTHAPGAYSPGTQDYAYGYSASIALSQSRAVLNADSYALYSNAIYLNC